MKAEYRRDLQNNYLILEAPLEVAEDDYQIRMAEQNRIPGLLVFRSSRMDGKLFLHYEITSKHQLEGLYNIKPLNYRDIIFLLTSVAETIEEMQKYLLNPALLVFDPQYIYVSADRKRLFLCFLPGDGSVFPIVLLAEFILKKLNHEDGKAIELGYRFYQMAASENFSLQKTVKELLTESRRKEMQECSGTQGLKSELPSGMPQQEVYGAAQNPREARREICGAADPKTGRRSKETEPVHSSRYQTPAENEWGEFQKEEFEVEHKQRRSREKKEGMTRRLFQAVHPAVLLSGLILLIVLEIVFYFGLIGITEAGGIFFFLIAAEALINKLWKSSKKKNREHHETSEGDHEAYRELWEEMYPGQGGRQAWPPISEVPEHGAGNDGQGRQMPAREANRRRSGMERHIPGDASAGQYDYGYNRMRKDGSAENEQQNKEAAEEAAEMEIKETCCLASVPKETQAKLVCRAAADMEGEYPDIEVWSEPVYIGKLREEADVILASPTVSRIHARLVCRKDGCFVKDLNSRNGTFVNQRRLEPQEECELQTGDVLRFAEVEYQVTIAEARPV